MLGFLKPLFFPHDKFTKKVLSSLNIPTSGKTLRMVCEDVTAGMKTHKVESTITRLLDGGFITIRELLLSNPPKPLYAITDKGIALLAE